MIASPQQPQLTPDEYLQMEAQSPVKHEYIDGEIYAIQWQRSHRQLPSRATRSHSSWLLGVLI